MPVDVVIPAFRDNAALALLLPRLTSDPGFASLRVVFGEADPEGEALCGRHAVEWLRAERVGRAAQMNAGAAKGAAEIIWFPHADTLPPPEARGIIEAAVAAGAEVGAFARRFEHPSRFLRASCRMADWRGRALGVFLGDQGMFARRGFFERLGGFDTEALYEDLDFSLRARRAKRRVLLEPPVVSSGRRFVARGPVRQTLLDLREGLRFALWPTERRDADGGGAKQTSHTPLVKTGGE